MAEETEKQYKSSSTQGFASRPEFINKNGRPKKGNAIADLMREYLDTNLEGQKEPNKKLFVMKVFQQAMSGDAACQKMIWEHIDGKPSQNVTVETPDIVVSPMAQAIKELREQTIVKNSNTDISDDTKS